MTSAHSTDANGQSVCLPTGSIQKATSLRFAKLIAFLTKTCEQCDKIPLKGVIDMLILFSAENFRSIAEEQTLSMVASKQYDKERSEGRKAVREKKLIRDKLPGLANASYLRTAAIYGSNASGKSNGLKWIALSSKLGKRPTTIRCLFETRRST